MLRRWHGLLAACVAWIASLSATEHVITVDGSKVITQHWIGNGVQWAAYPHCDTANEAKGFTYGPISDAQFERVLARLDVMQPQFMRFMIIGSWRYFEGFDSKGAPIVDYENEEMQFLYRCLDYCQSRGITVLFGEWGPRLGKSSGKSAGRWKSLPAYDERWMDMIADMLHHLIVVKGYDCIRYYDFENEPYLSWSYSGGDFKKYTRGMRLLHEALERRSIRDRILLNCSWGSGWPATTLKPEQVKSIAPYADIYDEHHYMGQKPALRTDWSKRIRKHSSMIRKNDREAPGFFVGETNFKPKEQRLNPLEEIRDKGQPVPNTGKDSTTAVFEWENGVDMAVNAIQKMRGGLLGAIAWQFDDAMHTQDDSGRDLKRWGFFDSMGEAYSGRADLEELRPWFYTWTLMCRSFPQGMQILDTENGIEDGISAVAGRMGIRWVVALASVNPEPRTVRVRWTNGPQQAGMRQYVYFEDQWPRSEIGEPLPVRDEAVVDLCSGVDVHFSGVGFVLLELDAYSL
jgi:hypothetical protein